MSQCSKKKAQVHFDEGGEMISFLEGQKYNITENNQNSKNTLFDYMPVRLCYIKIFIMHIYIITLKCKPRQDARIVKTS